MYLISSTVVQNRENTHFKSHLSARTNTDEGSNPSPSNSTTDYRSSSTPESQQYQGVFTFGVNPKFKNKKVLGSKEYYSLGWETKHGSIIDLLDWVSSGKAIMCGTLPNSRTSRRKNNVVSAQAIALDIDEGLSIEDCLKIPFVRDYAAAIYTSASHQKQKGDVAPCDRYRMIFLLPVAVVDIPLYEQSVKVVMEAVGHADKACKDASRMFFGYDNTEVILCDETKVLPANFLDEVGDRLKAEKAERARLLEERKRRVEKFGDQGTDLETIQLALDAISPDCPYEEWLAVGMALHSHDANLFYLWDDWSSCGSKYPKGGSRQLERQWTKFSSGGGTTLGSLFHIAQQHGFKFPKRERGSGRKGGDRLIDAAEYGLKAAGQYIEQLNQRAIDTAASFKQLFKATTEPVVNAPDLIRWQNGDPVPSREEWGDRKAPTFITPKGDTESHIALIGELFANGWGDVLDNSFMGSGKTHRAAMIELFDLFVKQVYIDKDHNNPSVLGIEETYANLWPRHSGLYKSKDGKLSRKKKQYDLIAVKGNCPSSELFILQSGKGLEFADGDSNPICRACPHKNYCGHSPHMFKAQRKAALGHSRIRADLQSLPLVSDDRFPYSSSLAIIEESTTQARECLIKTSGTKGDLLCNFSDIERSEPEIYEQIKPIKDAILDLMEAKQGRYGLTHDEIMAAMPTELDGDALEEISAWIEAVLTPEYELTEADGVTGAGKKFAHLQRQINREHARDARETNLRHLESLANCVLLPLIKVLQSGNGAIRIVGEEITITRLDERKRQAIQAFKGRLHLDATGNIEAIAAGFGIDVNSIVTIQEELPSFDNLTVYQTHMTGIKTRQRSEAAQARIEAYKDAIRELHPNARFLDFKGETDIDGYWFRDNRGSNKFKGSQYLASIGLPFPHIGAIEDEYRTFFGSLNGKDRYYQRLVQDEVTQQIGRPRVQHYLDQQFELDIVASFKDFDLSFLTERYGIKVFTRDAAEFCPAAGTTAERLKHGIFDIAKAVKAAGGKLTQQAIANAMGITQQNLSKHLKALWGNWFELKKLLQLYLLDTNRFSCKNSEQPDGTDPSIAAGTLIDCFISDGLAGIRAYLEVLPPNEARYNLGCLLSVSTLT